MSGSVTAAWAKSYAACGWRVFPAAEKVPAFKGWQAAATTDPELIDRWWPTDGWATNVAVVTGESFDVFDVEAAHVPALAAFMRRGGHQVPPTPIAISGRRGLHIFTAPVGVEGTRRLELTGVHIGEVKSRGGLVLVCPSVTDGQYTWHCAPSGLPVAPAPGWLRGLVRDPVAAAETPIRAVTTTAEMTERLEMLAATVARTETGNRNAMLWWAARRAGREGIDERVAARVLARAAMDAGLHRDRGGPDAIGATIRSGFARARTDVAS